MNNSESATFISELLKALGSLIAKIGIRLAVAIIAIFLGWLVVRFVSYLIRKLVKALRVPTGMRGIIVSLCQGVLWLILVIIVLSILGFSDVIIFFSSSVAAVGLIMAAGGGTLISDILAGIFLAEHKNFKIGDKVRAGENETEGIIEGMDMRRIEIRGKDGKLHVLPNSVVERKEWVVLATKAELAKIEREKEEKTKKSN